MQQQLLQFPGSEPTNAEEVLSLLQLLGSSITIKQNQYKINMCNWLHHFFPHPFPCEMYGITTKRNRCVTGVRKTNLGMIRLMKIQLQLLTLLRGVSLVVTSSSSRRGNNTEQIRPARYCCASSNHIASWDHTLQFWSSAAVKYFQTTLTARDGFY